MAAIAEAKEIVITSERLAEILKQSGVRPILRELELAPEKLSEWGILQPIDNGYRVVVPLLRRWVADNRPLRKAQDEVYKIADRQFQLAQDEYKLNNLPEAERLLRNALARNDEHLDARLLLGDVLTELGRTEETIETLQKAYEQNPKRARADLIKALLTMAGKRAEQEAELLKIYERVLNADPEQIIAQEGRCRIWKRRGETALAEKRWEGARNAFKEANDEDGLKKTEQIKHRHDYDTYRQKAEQYEQEKDWASAVRTWEILVQDYGDVADCQPQLLEANKQVSFEKSYNEALEALDHGNLKIATNLLAWVIGQQADYKEAPRHLLRALYGTEIDVAKLKPYKAVLQAHAIEFEPAKLVSREPETIEAEKSKEPKTELANGEKPAPISSTHETPIPAGPSPMSSILPALQKLGNSFIAWLRDLLPVGAPRKELLIACGVSGVVWLPLLVSSLVLYKNNNANELIANLGLVLFIISAVALVVTGWFAHRYKLWERAKAFLMMIGERLKLPKPGIIPASMLVVAAVMYALPLGLEFLLKPSSVNIQPVEIDGSGSDSTKSSQPATEEKEGKPYLSIAQLADSLMALLPGGEAAKIAEVTGLLNDSLAHATKEQRKALDQRFKAGFYSRAIDYLKLQNKPASDSLAQFLIHWQNPKTLSPLYEKYSALNNAQAKEVLLEVVKGLAQSRDKQIRSDLKIWLGVQQYWEIAPAIAADMKTIYASLTSPPATSKIQELINLLPGRLLFTDPKQAAADMMSIADAPSLYDYVKNKDGQFNDDFYKKALTLLQTGPDHQKRGVALFLSRLQTKKLRERICNNDFWNASNAETKRLCLVILASVAQNSEERNGVRNCLNDKQKRESGEIVQVITHTLSKIQ
jgi:tetratricopeptide (TPR) repeat protein